MNSKWMLAAVALTATIPAAAADSPEAREGRLQWFREARFGCFVHWGVYSQLGNEWHGKRGGSYAEHIQRVLKIPMADYRHDAVEKFNPVNFDADAWVSLAKRAGMRYFVITAKHHDGFAMYDSAVSDYNVAKATPWHHDPMKDLEAACKKQDIRFGFYYSHAFDWGDEHAPGNDWQWHNPGGDLLLGGAEWWLKMPEKLADVRANYVDRKSIPQVRELIGKYHPDILWFDTAHKLPLEENLRILAAAREAGPNVVINGRITQGSVLHGDYKDTGDRAMEFPNTPGDWETVPTTNESYGWNPLDHSHKSPETLIRVLAKAVSRGGNVLLNIGPMPDGRIDPKDVAILEGIGRWMEGNEPSIRGCGRAPVPVQPWGVVTAHDRRLYLHVFQWPSGPLVVGGLRSTPARAWLLTDPKKSPLKLQRMNETDLSIAVPNAAPDTADSVVALEFDEQPKGGGIRLISGDRTITNQLLAFDAERRRGDASGEAAGFGQGDGKTNRYYLTGWTDPRQSLAWEFRLNMPARFNVVLRYTKGSGTGRYEVQCGEWKASRAVSHEVKTDRAFEEPLGSIELAAGTHRMEIHALEVTGGEIFRPLEVQLVIR
jgi:alpha-L-fucosidase